MTKRAEVLIAIVNDWEDFLAARDQHWYRIPVSSKEKWLKQRWPPEYLAFYQTNEFGPERHAVHWYAKVRGISNVARQELFPDEPPNAKSCKRYYRLDLEPLQRLSSPIVSQKSRKIVFIPTTWEKFANASEINDLFDDSPLEDRLWAVFKERQIPAERQFFLEIESVHYALDFAIWCEKEKLDVEVDGDGWHANKDKAELDNLRDHALIAQGWNVLRFTTRQIIEELDSYSIPRIRDVINQLGGIDEGRVVPRKIDLDRLTLRQRGLYDES
ncbi:MAG: endonuclease domain-containing protein [Pirellulaceae bacterium]